MGDTTDHLLESAEIAMQTGEVSIEKIAGLHIKTLRELALSPEVQTAIDPLLEELRNLLVGVSLMKELSNRTKDYLVSFGERLSVRIAGAYFTAQGLPAKAMDAWDAGFISDSNFSSAELLKESWDRIPRILNPLLDEGVLPVITGFIAKDGNGKITTLGRGGSDRSATIIAAACKAEEAQVWKDVDGILTADPRIVPAAKPVEAVTYEEAAELAYFGAQVLHPWAMRPCMKTNTPVLVKNSYNPKAPGTRIFSARPETSQPVLAITSRRNVTLIDIVSTRMVGQSGFLEKVFAVFAKHGVSVDMVATSEVSISVSLDSSYDLAPLLPALTEIALVEVKTGRAIVTIIGNVRRSSEILQRAFSVCQQNNIAVQMVSQGASKVNMSFIVSDFQAAEAVKNLHREFFI
jgi:aspartate kinase